MASLNFLTEQQIYKSLKLSLEKLFTFLLKIISKYLDLLEVQGRYFYFIQAFEINA